MSEWKPIEDRPRDQTVLVAVSPTESNVTFLDYGPRVHPAYIDDFGTICDPSTWKEDSGLNGRMWRATHWMPLPEPPPPALTDMDPSVPCGANA